MTGGGQSSFTTCRLTPWVWQTRPGSYLKFKNFRVKIQPALGERWLTPWYDGPGSHPNIFKFRFSLHMVRDDWPPIWQTSSMVDHAGHCYTKDLLPVRLTISLVLCKAKGPLWWAHLNIQELIFGRSSGRSTPQYAKHHRKSFFLKDQLADLPPLKCWFEIHTGRFLLWELRQTVWELRQIKWQNYPPPQNGDLKFILIDSYSESFRRPVGRSSGRPIPPRKWWFQIHTDSFLLWVFRQTRWQIKWQIYPLENGNLRCILIDSYSESSGRPGGRSSGRSIPKQMAIWDSYW